MQSALKKAAVYGGTLMLKLRWQRAFLISFSRAALITYLLRFIWLNGLSFAAQQTIVPPVWAMCLRIFLVIFITDMLIEGIFGWTKIREMLEKDDPEKSSLYPMRAADVQDCLMRSLLPALGLALALTVWGSFKGMLHWPESGEPNPPIPVQWVLGFLWRFSWGYVVWLLMKVTRKMVRA